MQLIALLGKHSDLIFNVQNTLFETTANIQGKEQFIMTKTDVEM